MTLVLGATVGGSFCVTSGDTLTAFFEAETDNKTNRIYVSDKIIDEKRDSKKAQFVSDYVIWGAAGMSDIIEHIKAEFLKRVEPKSSLMGCSLILDEIIEEMRAEENPPAYYQFLDDEEQGEFGIILNGFNYAGESGFAYFYTGLENVMIRYAKKGEYDYMMWSPSLDYTDKKEEFLDLTVHSKNKVKLDDVVNQFLKVHTLISFFEHQAVSEICEYKTLELKRNPERGLPLVKKKSGQKDVSQFYRKMRLE